MWPQWPPSPDNVAAIQAYIQTHGLTRFQAAVSQGQHAFSDGLFFGGTAPTWNNRTLREVLRQHGRRARRLGWIDLHTGLGPSGLGERIFACRDDAAALQRARQWWDSARTFEPRSEDAKSDIVSCKVGGATRFMSQTDCQNSGGRVSGGG